MAADSTTDYPTEHEAQTVRADYRHVMTGFVVLVLLLFGADGDGVKEFSAATALDIERCAPYARGS